MRLTHQILESGYEFLRTTPPMRGWRLPHADEVEFKVSQRNLHGEYTWPPHRIEISAARHNHTNTILMSLAHEMVHLFQSIHKLDKGREHNEDFFERAALICRYHGWDKATF